MEGGELGFGFAPLDGQFGEPIADAGAHGGGGRAVGDVFQRPDLRVLLPVQFLDDGFEGGGFGVAAGGGFGVGGRELRGQQRGAAGAEDAVQEELGGHVF